MKGYNSLIGKNITHEVILTSVQKLYAKTIESALFKVKNISFSNNFSEFVSSNFRSKFRESLKQLQGAGNIRVTLKPPIV